MKKLAINDLQDKTLVVLSESELVALVKEESEAFTTKRERIHEYVEDARKVSAYTLFYLPTNMPKLYFLLDQLLRVHSVKILEEISRSTFVDVGTGPGTFSLALLFYLKDKGYTLPTIQLIDQSQLMLLQAKKLIKEFFPEVEVQTDHSYHEFLNKDHSRALTVFFGNSLNELSDVQTEEYFKVITTNRNVSHVFWIEPGTPAFFKKQLNLRSTLITSNFSLLFPCANNSSCPLENQSGEWCHQILRTTHAIDVERISQLVSLDRKILPMCAMVFARENKINQSPWIFPLRFLAETKYSFNYLFCGQFELNQSAVRLEHRRGEVIKKNLSKKMQRHFKERSLGYPIIVDEKSMVIKKEFVRLEDLGVESNYTNLTESEN